MFDARRELTEQTKALQDLNSAVVANGGEPIPIPALPTDADVQAFPPKPSAFAEGSRALSEGSLGLIPDVAKDLHTINNWDQASGADKLQAGLDAAGLPPIPGSKLLGEGLEHALPGTAHHLDDIPAPHAHADAPAAGHADAPPVEHTVEAPPLEHHATPDTPVEHHSGGDTGHVVPHGVDDTGALLAASEATGGHLIDRHVGQTFEDLSGRLDSTRLPVVSSFGTTDEAASAVSTALQHNQQVVDQWISNGATGKLELDAPFNGGEVLRRGSTELVAGTGVRVVLKGDGTGGWYVLTGFPTP